jgi:hypothetical protein
MNIRYKKELSIEEKSALEEAIAIARKDISNFDEIHKAILITIWKNVSLTRSTIKAKILEEYLALLNSNLDKRITDLVNAKVIKPAQVETIINTYLKT